MFRHHQQMDRPTNNTLLYLTKVRGHEIRRGPQTVDPYVLRALRDFITEPELAEFFQYTRSFYTIEGHYSNLWHYDRETTPRPTHPAYQAAVEHVREVLRLPQPAQSYRWDELSKVPFIPSSGSGYGYRGKKGAPGNHEIAISRAVWHLNTWLERPDTYRYTPDLAWTRTQLGHLDAPKIRNVWGKAFHNILLEGLCAEPLIRAYQQLGDPIVTGIHTHKRLPAVVFDILRGQDTDGHELRYGIGTDFKAFDSCPQEWLIRDAFSILRENIIIDDEMTQHAWEHSIEFFLNTPVVMPDGRMWLKRIGIPSGSYFTQLVGSVVNLIVQTYIQLRIWGRAFKTYVLGDDSAFGLPYTFGYPNLTRMAVVGAELGFTIHPDKIVVALRPDEMEFLGHVARGTRVDREVAKMLRLALFPEYPVEGPDMSVARVKGLLIDSGLTNWPLINLYRYMRIMYSSDGGAEWHGEDKDWLRVVLGLTSPPSQLDLVKIFTLT